MSRHVQAYVDPCLFPFAAILCFWRKQGPPLCAVYWQRPRPSWSPHIDRMKGRSCVPVLRKNSGVPVRVTADKCIEIRRV